MLVHYNAFIITVEVHLNFVLFSMLDYSQQ